MENLPKIEQIELKSLKSLIELELKIEELMVAVSALTLLTL